MKPLQGKVAAVTGAGRGIGLALARSLARDGADLILIDNGCESDGSGGDPAVIQLVAKDLRSLGVAVHASDADVRNDEAFRAALHEGIEQLGSRAVTIAVHAAGISRPNHALKTTCDDLSRTFDVQVRGAFALASMAARTMIDKKKAGSILLLTSPMGWFGTARAASLSAASSAVGGLVRSAALDLRRHDIRVNAIAVTARTRLTENLPLFQSIREDSMRPEDIVALASFLVSEESKDVSGEIFAVAGQRVYAIRSKETAGVVFEKDANAADIAARLPEILRGS